MSDGNGGETLSPEDQQLGDAISEVLGASGTKKSVRQIARDYAVNRNVLIRWVSKIKKRLPSPSENHADPSLIFETYKKALKESKEQKAFPSYFTEDEEAIFKHSLFALQRAHEGFDKKQIRAFAGEAVRRKFEGNPDFRARFLKRKGGVGVQQAFSDVVDMRWVDSFLKRHPDVKLNTVSKLEMKRAEAANIKNFNYFFDLLKKQAFSLLTAPRSSKIRRLWRWTTCGSACCEESKVQ